jgi:DDE superfamily endonuclease
MFAGRRLASLRCAQLVSLLSHCATRFRPTPDVVPIIAFTLTNLGADEAFFSIDELGPVAVKMRGGRPLQLPGQIRTVPQWQKSRGAFILTAALDLAKNQIFCFFSEHKNTKETIRLVEGLRERYATSRKLHLSWDSAPWHRSVRLKEQLTLLNDRASRDRRPRIETLPLPTSAQFLNVIESVFSGMARAVLHNSDYATLEDAQAAVTRYFDDRNDAFQREPRRAGRTIWGVERTPASFSETNNCKDPPGLGLR